MPAGMKRCLVGFILLAACAGAAGEVADPGAQARAIFAVRCVKCHGADVARPKGKFGYVLDLKRVAANPKLIVPFDPAASKVWEDVERDKMPPEGATNGPLSDVEKHAVRAWIEAGAPRPLAKSPDAPASSTNTTAAASPVRTRVLRLLGKLHVPMVHFPIALLAAAALAELGSVWKKRTEIHPIVRYCLLLGTAGALVAAGLGWIHAPFSGFAPSSRGLLLHRWVGTSVAALAGLTVVAAERDVRKRRRGNAFVALLLLTAAAVVLAGHLGGMLVNGDDYYEF